MSKCAHRLVAQTQCPKCKQQMCVECFANSVKENMKCPSCQADLTVAYILDLCSKDAILSSHSLKIQMSSKSIQGVRKRGSIIINPDFSKIPEFSKLPESPRGDIKTKSVLSSNSDVTIFVDENSYRPDPHHAIFENPDSPEFITYTKEKGWDFKIIQTATLEKMVEVITRPSMEDPYFAECLVFGYPTVTTKEELLSVLMKRFNPAIPDKMGWDDFLKSYLAPIRMKVMGFVRSWVKWRFIDFEDVDMRSNLETLVSMYEAFKPKMARFMREFIDKQDAKFQQKNLSSTTNSDAKVKVVGELKRVKDLEEVHPLFCYSVRDVARHITVVQFELFRKIPVEELLSQCWMKKDNKTLTPNIVAMIQMTNKISYLVQNMILSFEKLSHRIFAVEYFVRVAEVLKQVHNFDGFKAVVAALDSSAVFRLKDTREGLSEEVKRLLDEFNGLVNYESNFKKLRDITAVCEAPVIPFLGSTLGDLVFTKENEKSENGQLKLINFFRVRTYGSMLKEIVMKQDAAFEFGQSPEVHAVLEKIQIIDNEDQLFQLSTKLETPRSGEASKEEKKKISKARDVADKLWKKSNSYFRKTLIGGLISLK
ncbi:guanine nucleotide exchange factor, putative [Entamoeba invadens IP1]|uniref:Guanine nucleotide exchange factor, putative n=1 Tax=Entamoeba invadens IP1 TaxID=370355 RepID=A0A0A1U4J9_ENTIV|nr:guanine nucleotide exchange factor, putative [Entamoeba invadens IP1]ELP86635.1 guanine nucleotide exchange factor, putative [Entamoeba invadens IP1]|eukprot:XP_004185981.1 guanine nucleotide exchange factor, putative [Entamoeba invadens IP1]